MLAVIGEVLGQAIGVALSPMAVVGFILVLVSAGGLPKAWAFLGGWAGGVTVVLVVVGLAVSGASERAPDESRPIVASIQLLLGAGLVFLAWRTWQQRPAHGEEPALPGWMKAMDTVTLRKAAGLGFILSAANPKNLALLLASAGSIGQAPLDTAESTVVFAIFVLLSCLGMLVPILVYLASGENGPRILGSLREWLVRNNATIMAVLFVVLGSNVFGKGLGGF